MKTNLKFSSGTRVAWRQRGFALIATLMVTALLVLLVMALLSLSSVSRRQSSSHLAQEQARANAQMSLQLAIGELQRAAGPDMRVTAPAPTLAPAKDDPDAREPKDLGLTGVWRSWENSDFPNPTKEAPSAPDYSQKLVPGIPGDAKSLGRFIGWLASKKAGETDNATKPPMLTARTGAVPLLAAGTLGSEPEGSQIHLEPVEVERGALAWWVGGENTKALLSFPDIATRKTVSHYRTAMATHAIPDAKALGLAFDKPVAEVATRLVTRKSIDIAATLAADSSGKQGKPGEKFHHLSTNSYGLLTNTNAGGWRKDISLLAEFLSSNPGKNPANWPQYGLDDEWIYPWAKTRFPGGPMWQQVGPVLSWRALADFVNQYREITGTGSGTGDFLYNSSCGDIGNTAYAQGFLHNVNRMPVMADIRYLCSYSSKPSEGKYKPCLVLTPVMTLWNPWNYRVSINRYRLSLNNMPIKFNMTVGGKTFDLPFYKLVGNDASSQSGAALSANFKSSSGSDTILLGPGETMIFSAQLPELQDTNATVRNVDMYPGYRNTGGMRFEIKDGAGATMSLPAGSDMKVNSISVTEANAFQTDQNRTLTGIYYDLRATVTPPGSGPVDLWVSAPRMQYLPAEAEKYYKPVTEFSSVKVEAVADAVGAKGTNNQLFYTSGVAFRAVNETQVPEFRSRGLHQMNPNALYLELGIKSGIDISNPGAGIYYGAMHPVNSPIELLMIKHSGWSDTTVPNVAVANRGFVMTGYYKYNGLSRCILEEIPVRPMLSLGELQNFQVRGQNPFPPFRNNIFGNSVAYPIFPPDVVRLLPTSAQYKDYFMQFDDSYCMNRMFWDDFFVSSVVPEMNGLKGSVLRTMKEVYRDHIRQASADQELRNKAVPLPNAQYQPTPSTLEEDAAIGLDLELDKLKSGDSTWKAWTTIASRFQVKGMFNVNSTSVEAWKSILSHARDMPVTTLKSPNAKEASSALDKTSGHPVSRNTVSGDDSSESLTGYQKLSGFRRLTDEQIDALALEIVKQIRRRGPALSLSEFVNRQLRPAGDANVALAVAGPVQAALDELAKYSTDQNPFKQLQEYCQKVERSTSPIKDPSANYVFPEAVAGWTGEGMPGWTTQADVLRPLAPVLSVRDDTFVIRTFGESKSKAGKVLARVWCEAIVQRQGEYFSTDPKTDKIESVSDANLNIGAGKDLNTRFGRRFKVISFRYLTPSEV